MSQENLAKKCCTSHPEIELEPYECMHCRGEGYVDKDPDPLWGDDRTWETCRACNGTGDDFDCWMCREQQEFEEMCN
jgi:DnaJ-class molecular chaperone